MTNENKLHRQRQSLQNEDYFKIGLGLFYDSDSCLSFVLYEGLLIDIKNFNFSINLNCIVKKIMVN